MKEEPIVVRPSGIWNSRSPLNDYVLIVRKVHRAHSATSLAAQYLSDRVAEEAEDSLFVRDFVTRTTQDPQRREKYSRMYNRSFGVERDRKAKDQTISTLARDRSLVERSALQHATVQLNGAIENYIQCWFLNVCLSKIESGEGLNKTEAGLIDEFNPAKSRRSPNLGHLIHRYSYLRELLETIPPFRRHPKTRREVSEAESPERSARWEISYWQNYRNLLVHANGHCSPEFAEKFGSYHAYKRSLSRRIPVLESLRPLPIDENLLTTQAACFYRVAYLLREELLKASWSKRDGIDYFRRGHRHAPGPRGEGGEDVVSPPMLVEGDHSLSLRWTKDAAFRAETARTRGWKGLR